MTEQEDRRLCTGEGPRIATFSSRFGYLCRISKHPKGSAVGQVLGSDRE